MQQVANALKVTVGFLMQLQNGTRPTASISADLARACANYLCVSPVVVMLVSGFLRSEDFESARSRTGAL
jgi:hypothetical protein